MKLLSYSEAPEIADEFLRLLYEFKKMLTFTNFAELSHELSNYVQHDTRRKGNILRALADAEVTGSN